MRPTLTFLAALLAVLIAASPAAAHHKPGHNPPGHAKKDDSGGGKAEGHGAKSEDRGGFAGCDWQSDPDSCPGNSGWAHWCKWQHGPGPARGQCVAEHARGRGVEVGRDDDGEHGDLRITAIDVDDDGSLRVRGRGAEGSVVIWVGGGSGEVVGFGQGEADGEGGFDITGLWACQDNDDPHEARVRAQDADERSGDPATFPCDEED